MEDVEGLVDCTEQRRRRVSSQFDARDRDRMGQFFTPALAARLIASMPRLPRDGCLRVLDPGAGVGSLTAALAARVIRESPAVALDIVAVDMDPTLTQELEETLRDCTRVTSAHGAQVTATCLTADFPAAVTRAGETVGPLAGPFDIVIMNPPYGKLPSNAPLRRRLSTLGVECPNLYSAFLAVGAMVLADGGQLVSITPRSFANGPYFKDFRGFLFERLAVDKIHVFESRSTIFSDSGVLQENVVLSATLGGSRDSVVFSSSRGHEDASRTRTVPYEAVIHSADQNRVLHVHTDDEDISTAQLMASIPCTLDEINLGVSTGRVVDFRVREFLSHDVIPGSAPLIYPGNLRDGGVHWPSAIRKPQAIIRHASTAKLLLPNERFVLVKRFSSKEERRRIVAAVHQPREGTTEDLGLPPEVGFENHLNVFHRGGRGLPPDLAAGLCLWLNSTVVDRHFRTFSGHTQVNATDLRSMRYPTAPQLSSLGSALGHGHWPSQEKIDSLVTTHILDTLHQASRP